MRAPLAILLLAACLGLAAACQGGPSPGEPLDFAPTGAGGGLRLLTVQPEDIGELNWVVADERSLSGGELHPLSAGLPATVTGESKVQPDAGFERLIEGYPDDPFGEKGWPPLLYSAVLEFASVEEAERFFEASAELAPEADWLDEHPDTGAEGVTETLVREVDIPLDSSVSVPSALLALDDILWLRLTGLISGGVSLTIDDVVLMRQGSLWAMVRVPDHLPRFIQPKLEVIVDQAAARLLEEGGMREPGVGQAP